MIELIGDEANAEIGRWHESVWLEWFKVLPRMDKISMAYPSFRAWRTPSLRSSSMDIHLDNCTNFLRESQTLWLRGADSVRVLVCDTKRRKSDAFYQSQVEWSIVCSQEVLSRAGESTYMVPLSLVVQALGHPLEHDTGIFDGARVETNAYTSSGDIAWRKFYDPKSDKGDGRELIGAMKLRGIVRDLIAENEPSYHVAGPHLDFGMDRLAFLSRPAVENSSLGL